jgi:hypothetical protein
MASSNKRARELEFHPAGGAILTVDDRITAPAPKRRGRGRPPGSKNKTKGSSNGSRAHLPNPVLTIRPENQRRRSTESKMEGTVVFFLVLLSVSQLGIQDYWVSMFLDTWKFRPGMG